MGDEPFRRELLAAAHNLATENHHAGTRRETAEEKARRIVEEELAKLGWTAADLREQLKGDERKLQIAMRLRRETPMTLKWIAAQLHMGTWTHVSNLLGRAKRREQEK